MHDHIKGGKLVALLDGCLGKLKLDCPDGPHDSLVGTGVSDDDLDLVLSTAVLEHALAQQRDSHSSSHNVAVGRSRRNKNSFHVVFIAVHTHNRLLCLEGGVGDAIEHLEGDSDVVVTLGNEGLVHCRGERCLCLIYLHSLTALYLTYCNSCLFDLQRSSHLYSDGNITRNHQTITLRLHMESKGVKSGRGLEAEKVEKVEGLVLAISRKGHIPGDSLLTVFLHCLHERDRSRRDEVAEHISEVNAEFFALLGERQLGALHAEDSGMAPGVGGNSLESFEKARCTFYSASVAARGQKFGHDIQLVSIQLDGVVHSMHGKSSSQERRKALHTRILFHYISHVLLHHTELADDVLVQLGSLNIIKGTKTNKGSGNLKSNAGVLLFKFIRISRV
mmetsp:Transcript_538/g.1110  ORF Transcript_538/g.1110 Transcript_538/m.1110 type:complete len:391 (-) Transcript_538:522-1694(-)